MHPPHWRRLGSTHYSFGRHICAFCAAESNDQRAFQGSPGVPRALPRDIEVVDFEKICTVVYGAGLPLPEVRKLLASEVNIKEDCWILSSRIIGPDGVVTRNNKLTATCSALRLAI